MLLGNLDIDERGLQVMTFAVNMIMFAVDYPILFLSKLRKT